MYYFFNLPVVQFHLKLIKVGQVSGAVVVASIVTLNTAQKFTTNNYKNTPFSIQYYIMHKMYSYFLVLLFDFLI